MASKRSSPATKDVRPRILAAARAEFMAHGYEDASINRIIQEAGIHKGSLYHYFEDKADLFLTVLRAVTEEMTRTIEDLNLEHVSQEPPKDFWGFLERASIQKIYFAIHHPGLMRLGSEILLQSSKPTAPARFKAYIQTEVHDLTAGFLRLGQAQGAVRSDMPMTTLTRLTYAVTEIMNQDFLEDPTLIERFGPEEIRQYAHQQVDMLRRMLSVPEGGTNP